MFCGRSPNSPNGNRLRRASDRAIWGLSALLLLGVACSRSSRIEARLRAYAQKIGAPAAVTHFPRPEEMDGQGSFRQADWFKLAWLQRRLIAWEQRPADRGAIVFLGDSIIHGWTNLSATFPGLKVANHGLAGDTTRGALYRLQPDVLELRPRAVVLLCGINDLSEGDPPESALENFRAMLQRGRASDPELRVILCQVLPTGNSPPGVNAQVQRLNQMLDGLVDPQGKVRVAKTWVALADTNGQAALEDFPDRLHPNASGYRKLAAVLRPLLMELPERSPP